MIHNMVGGGSGKLFAVIAVTYPAGSICTCVSGTKTLKARDTSGKALFNVTVGEWTVSCTDGTDTASKAVSITSEGQAVSVELSYRLYLYKNGDKCTDVGGNWSFSKEYSDGASISYGADKVTISLESVHLQYMGVCFWYKKIDITNYSKLCMLVSYNSASSATQGICVYSSVPENPMLSGSYEGRQLIKGSSDTVPFELDISAISGSKYVGYGASMGDTDSGSVQIKEVYLV